MTTERLGFDPDEVFTNDSCPHCGTPVVWTVEHAHIMETLDPGAIHGDGPPEITMKFACCRVHYTGVFCGTSFVVDDIFDEREPDYEVTPGGF